MYSQCVKHPQFLSKKNKEGLRGCPCLSILSYWKNQCRSDKTVILNTLRPRRNRRHFSDDIFKCILLNETVLISIKISLKFIPKGPINNILALVQIMAWRRPGDKPLSEPMMIISLTHICITQPQSVNALTEYTCLTWLWFNWCDAYFCILDTSEYSWIRISRVMQVYWMHWLYSE